MAVLSITASEVDAGTGVPFETYVADDTIAPGDAIYVTGGNLAKLADNNVDAATAKVQGIAMNTAVAGQKVTIQTAGDWTVGATASVAAGDVFWLSSTPGKYGPEADVTSGQYMTAIGIGITGNKIRLNIKAFGSTHA